MRRSAPLLVVTAVIVAFIAGAIAGAILQARNPPVCKFLASDVLKLADRIEDGATDISLQCRALD